MRSFILIVCLYAYTHVHAQNPFDHTSWTATTLIGMKDSKFDAKAAEMIFTTLDKNRPYGYITEFLPDNQFSSYNQGPCGNECRTQVKGTYLATRTTIELFVISISYSKDCSDRPIEVVNTSLGIYSWEQKDNQLFLKPLGK